MTDACSTGVVGRDIESRKSDRLSIDSKGATKEATTERVSLTSAEHGPELSIRICVWAATGPSFVGSIWQRVQY